MDVLINLKGQKLSMLNCDKKFISGTQEFVYFKFLLSDDWKGLSVFAQFIQNKVPYNVYLDDNNGVYLPPEIGSGTCTLMLYGSYKNVIATTNYLTLTIDENILVSDANSTEISQSLYNQLITKFNTGRLNNWWYLKSGDSLGDSLTGQGFFQSWTKRYFGLNSFANHGVGGSKLSGADVDSTRPSMWKDERINTLSTTADFITVLGGQNDGNVAIGDISKSNYDTDTYVGALNTIIDKIYDHCKQGVIIILCTPFYVPAEGDDGERFDVLGNAVREVGKLRGLPVADFGGLCTADKKTADLYWGTDRTHPNENFYRDKIAPILISTMESIKPINWENVNYYD